MEWLFRNRPLRSYRVSTLLPIKVRLRPRRRRSQLKTHSKLIRLTAGADRWKSWSHLGFFAAEPAPPGGGGSGGSGEGSKTLSEGLCVWPQKTQWELTGVSVWAKWPFSGHCLPLRTCGLSSEIWWKGAPPTVGVMSWAPGAAVGS